jgi:hypothetical protein
LIAKQALLLPSDASLAQVVADFNEEYPGVLTPAKAAPPKKAPPQVLGSTATAGTQAKPKTDPLNRDEENQRFLEIMAEHGLKG